MSAIAEQAFGAAMGAVAAQMALEKQREQTCEQMKDLKKAYQEYYAVASDYIGGEQQKSKDLEKKTNGIRAQINVTRNKLESIKNETQKELLQRDFVLLIIFLIIAFMLYIKYTGLFKEEEFDIT
jgi:hypothetical protein